MIIEVVGIYERNKGALLMLEAIRARLAEDFPHARFAVATSVSASYRRQHGLLGVMRTGRSWKSRVRSLLPSFAIRPWGLVKGAKVDVVLDASGFGYGDFWGLPKLRDRLLNQVAAQHREGTIAVLLPQALGPFAAPGMAETFRRAVDDLDLVFVRDRASWNHVAEAVGSRPNVALAPDFTNLLHPPLPDRYSGLKGHGFVIPNEKMVSGDRASMRASYVRFLAQAVEAIRRSGRPVALLVHEGAKDLALAEEVNASLSDAVDIVNAPSPLDTKAIIAAADLLVSSRFHGLVSALANGVPSLACGWSHKYAELMSDYGTPELNLDLADENSWDPALDRLLSSAASEAFRKGLSEAATVQKQRSERMWQRTVDMIRSRLSS